MSSTVYADIVYALRTARSRPAFTAVVILTLAVGIGATTAMFSTLDAAFLRRLPYAEPDRLVMGRATFDGEINSTVSGYDYYDYRDRSESFVSLAATTGFSVRYTITGAAEPDRVDGAFATWDLFKTLGVSPAAGRFFVAAEGSPEGSGVAVISYSYWQRRFAGSEEELGQALLVDGVPVIVVGVLPAGFHYLLDADLWFPTYRDGPWANARRFHNLRLVGRLKPGVSLASAQSEVDTISRQLEADFPDSNQGKALLLTPLHSTLIEDARMPLLLLMGAVALVLLIACGNVAGLLFARGLARRTEIAVRSSLGAPRARLVRQLLTESLLLAGAGGAVGMAFAWSFQKLFLRLLPMGQLGIVRVDFHLSVLLFALGTSLLTGLLFGTVPALRATALDLAEQLKPSLRSTFGQGRTRLRSSLVVVQVAISLVLLCGAGLMIRSFLRQVDFDYGFDPRHLLTAELRLPADAYPEPEQRNSFFTSLAAEARSLPGVEAVGLVSRLPIRDPWGNIDVYPAGGASLTPAEIPSAYMRIALPGYFEALRIPLVAGRDLSSTDVAGATPALVVSESLARRLFPDREPLGRRVVVDMGEPVEFELVGIVSDAQLSSIHDERTYAMYGCHLQYPTPLLRIAVRTAVDPASLTAPLREVLRRMDPDVPLAEPATMEAVLAGTRSDARIVTGSLGLFAAIALLLAAVGLYGVLAYEVRQRHPEIGLRMALGAERSDVLGWILGRGLLLVGTGWIVGLAGALAAARLLRQLLFETAVTDPLSFFLVSAFLALVALVACLIPAWRATRVDPARALYAE